MFRIIPRCPLRKNFQFKIVGRAGINTSKPHIVILISMNPRSQLVIQLNRTIPIIEILLDQSTHIIAMVCHPCTGIFNTRNSTLVRFAFKHSASTGLAFARNPLPGCSSRNGRNQHKQKYGYQRYAGFIQFGSHLHRKLLANH